MSEMYFSDLQRTNWEVAANNTVIEALQNVVQNPPAWQGARVLVPVMVEALVVTPAMERSMQWAETRTNEIALRNNDKANVFPKPFERIADDERAIRRKAGVHLHWALPDGLTQGEVISDDSETDNELPSNPSLGDTFEESIPPTDARFPYVPDRWLVVRLSAGSNNKRKARAWVIQSREKMRDTTNEEVSLNVTLLNLWRGESGTDSRWMTAIGVADPTYMAYYDNSRDIVGFYDAVGDDEEGPLTYIVMGWYATPHDDPLHEATNPSEWEAIMKRLKFDIEGDDVTRAEYAAEQMYYRHHPIEAENWRDDFEEPQVEITEDSEDYVTNFELSQNNLMTYIEANMDDLEIYVPETQVDLPQYFPRQMMLHGTIYDVYWNNGGGSYNGSPLSMGHIISNRPHSLEVSVGNTGVEALSALLSHHTGEGDDSKLISAFHYGMLAELSSPNGLSKLEALLHAEDFVSQPGGFILDRIQQGDIIPPEEQVNITMKDQPTFMQEIQKGQVVTQFMPAYQAYTLQDLTLIEDDENNQTLQLMNNNVLNLANSNATWQYMKPELQQTLNLVRQWQWVKRPMPRFYTPRDPVILLAGAKRSHKHGQDGRFSENDTLRCRLTGRVIYNINPVIGQFGNDSPPKASDLKRGEVSNPLSVLEDALVYGSVPYEVEQLLKEVLFLDEANAPHFASELDQLSRSFIGQKRGDKSYRMLSRSMLIDAIRNEQTAIWSTLQDEYDENGMNAGIINALSSVDGKVPSKVGVQYWQQPWTPLHLDWEVEYIESKQPQMWSLGEFDYYHDRVRDPDDIQGTTETYTGRTLITPGLASSFHDRVAKLLENDPVGDAGDVDENEERSFRTFMTALKNSDVLSANLSGFHDALLALQDLHEFTSIEEDVIDDDLTDDRVATAQDNIFPIRAGYLKIKRLRVVDAFGQFVEVDPVNMMHRATDMQIPSDNRVFNNWAKLPPRINAPSRLMFRLLDRDNDTQEATTERTPVCGWFVPDHLDEALEIYDSNGVNVGQVQLQDDQVGQEWFGVPGVSESLSSEPNLPNEHLQNVVQGLLDWSVKDTLYERRVHESAETDEPLEPRVSALSSLLRLIDATQWTVDPIGNPGTEALAVLVGRPLAIVRAKLELDIKAYPPEFEHLSDVEFEPFAVRLGALTDLGDGLMGYFINDNYSQFFPVHEELATVIRPNRPREGYLQPIHLVRDYHNTAGNEPEVLIDPVQHPYINDAPYVIVEPNKPVMLTLLLDPRGSVNVFSGILPRKTITLMREHVESALNNITLTFRVGPILSDPDVIRMPLPSQINGGWSWIQRSDVTTWTEKDVVNATEDALIPEIPSTIMEGWLKLKNAFDEEDNGDSPPTS